MQVTAGDGSSRLVTISVNVEGMSRAGLSPRYGGSRLAVTGFDVGPGLLGLVLVPLGLALVWVGRRGDPLARR